MKKIEIELNNSKIEIVNDLKSISIFTIVLMHLIQNYMQNIPSSIMKLSSIGGTGVHVFFLLSGFGLYLSYINKKTSYVEFIKKRFIKLYIPYILVVLISALIPYMYLEEDRIKALLSHIFLYKMFIPKYECSFGLHFWFVSTIIQFYFIAIPLFKLKKIGNKRFLILNLTISIIWWISISLLGLTNRIYSSFFLQYIWEFALGIVLADYIKSKNKTKKLEFNILIVLIIAIVGISLQYIMATSNKILKICNDIPALFGYLCLCIILLQIPILKKIITKLCKHSYELYLIHILIFEVFFHFFKVTNLFTSLLVGIFAFLASSLLSYFYAIIINSLKEFLTKKLC